MAVILTKGANTNLTRESPAMATMTVGLGWDARRTDGAAFDLDSMGFLLGESGNVRSDADFVFYNNFKSACGSVTHRGDNRTGVGDGDDEQLVVELGKIPADVQKIAFGATIHDSGSNRQNFGQVTNAFIRIVDNATGQVVVRYDLSEDFATETAVTFGELYRHAGDWKFRAVGQGIQGGLAALAQSFGVNV